MTRYQLSTAAAVLGLLLLGRPAAGAGQASMLDASEASAFMGTWTVTMETPLGASFEQTVTIRDKGGKVAVTVGPGGTAPSGTTTVRLDGNNLVIAYRMIAYLWGGPATPSDVVLTLTLNGETLTATQDFPRVQFRMSGTGKKRP